MADQQVMDEPSATTESTAAVADGSSEQSQTSDKKDLYDIKDPSLADTTVVDDAGPINVESEAEAGDETEDVEAPSDEIDDQLMARAVEAGLDEDEVKALGAENLWRVLDAHDRLIANLGRQDSDAKPTSAKKTQQAPPEFTIELDESFADDPVAGVVKSLHEHYEGRIAQLEDAIVEFQDSVKVQQAKQREQLWHDYYAKMGPEEQKIFGKGPTSELPRTSKAYRSRMKLESEFETLEIGYNAVGRSVAEAEMQDRAKRIAFGAEIKSMDRRQISDKLRDRRGQFISGPSSPGRQELPKGKDRAIANIEAKLRKIEERG